MVRLSSDSVKKDFLANKLATASGPLLRYRRSEQNHSLPQAGHPCILDENKDEATRPGCLVCAMRELF